MSIQIISNFFQLKILTLMINKNVKIITLLSLPSWLLIYADSTDSLGSLLPSSSFVHRFKSSFDDTPCSPKVDDSKFWLVGQHWCVYVGENVAYMLALTSSALPGISCLSYFFFSLVFDMEGNWPNTCCFFITSSRVCLKEHITSLWSFHQAFLPKVRVMQPYNSTNVVI